MKILSIWPQFYRQRRGPMQSLPRRGAFVVAVLAVLVAAQPVLGAAPSVSVRHGLRDKPVVALTFDDCYSAARARQIQLTLREKGVNATLFCTSGNVRANPELWRSILADGNEFGNHTKTHPNLTKLSESDIHEQICGARPILDEALGAPSANIFRPPYGRHNDLVLKVAGDCGYPHTILWDVDSRDWSGISSDEIARRALTGKNGSIVIMHIGPANTPGALGKIIHGYRKRGFEFVTVSELVARL